MCKYCESADFKLINADIADCSGLEIAISGKGMLRVRSYPNGYDSDFDAQDIVNIKACPMCGRRLN